MIFTLLTRDKLFTNYYSCQLNQSSYLKTQNNIACYSFIPTKTKLFEWKILLLY